MSESEYPFQVPKYSWFNRQLKHLREEPYWEDVCHKLRTGILFSTLPRVALSLRPRPAHVLEEYCAHECIEEVWSSKRFDVMTLASAVGMAFPSRNIRNRPLDWLSQWVFGIRSLGWSWMTYRRRMFGRRFCHDRDS